MHLEFYGDLVQAPADGHHFAQPRIKIVLQHGGTRMFEEEIRGFAYVATGDHVQLIARGNVLNNAGNVGEPHVAKCIGAVAAVVEDDPVLSTNGIEEI